jgi:FKBP-type peptidyl-prolyl cis-trans isomerase FklB
MTTETTLNTEVDKLSYSLGVNIAKNVKGQGIDSLNIAALSKAFADVYSGGNLLISDQEAGQIIQTYMQRVQAGKVEKLLLKEKLS